VGNFSQKIYTTKLKKKTLVANYQSEWLWLQVTLSLDPSLTLESPIWVQPWSEWNWVLFNGNWVWVQVLCRILFWQDLGLMKERVKKRSTERYRQVRQKNPKVGVKLQFRWENQFDPLLFHVYYYCDADLWFCLILGKTGLQYFKIGLFYSYLSIYMCVCVCVIHILPKKCTTLKWPIWKECKSL